MNSDAFLDDDSPLEPSDAAAVILLAPGDEYLLQLRDDKTGIFYPGHWGCFGGAVEVSDGSVEHGLRREIMEETGIDLPPGALTYFTNLTFDLGFAGIGVMGRAYYEARLSAAQIAGLRLGEGAAFRAVSAREALAGLKLVPYDAFALWLHANRRRLRPRSGQQ